MTIRSKFDGGKVYNRCNKGSWHARCYGGALRKNFGPAWSPVVWQKITSVKPGKIFTSVYRQRSFQLIYSARSQKKEDVMARKRKRRLISQVQSKCKRAKQDYGAEALEVVPDVTSDELERKCHDFWREKVNVSDERCKEIEQTTKLQSYSMAWKEERKVRLTASVFGDIIQRNVNRGVKCLLNRLLYSFFGGTRYTQFGIAAEKDTIKEYIQKKSEEGQSVKVERMGLYIDGYNKHLAASCDGKVSSNDGSCLIEIKNLLQRNRCNFKEAAKKIKSFCLKNINGALHLKKDHKYYFQIQGQLNITKFPWIDFIVRRTNPYQLRIERIFRDETLWNTLMVPELTAFYKKALLPELALPRHGTSTGIREPDLPWFIPAPAAQIETQKTTTDHRSACTTRKSKTKDTAAKAATSAEPVPSSSVEPVRKRNRRVCTKFVGRRILHEWCVDEASGQTKWYSGTVLDVLRGRDGQHNAVYEVLYDGDKEPHEVDDLYQDLQSSSLKFIDI